MKRYAFVVETDGPVDAIESAEVVEKPNGEYVKFNDVAAELTTLRQRLAEAEADIKQVTQHAEAWKEAFDREWNRAEKAQADAARWEGAARDLYTALKDFADGECHCDESEHECVQCCATKAITTASALVREGGSATLVAAKEEIK